ncbi:hypothetical protein [Sphingosinicella sp. YJ22]|uniref:hypothetical protein n=1 Tax=Sphingosinicella sp. YJ22 TaxID=1104780 RepID=UPI00140B9E4C|nr:hypothetical protein [Sphingosinicella sp. YJ22]
MRSFGLISALLALVAVASCGAPPPRNEQQPSTEASPSANGLPPLEESARSAERADLLPPDAVIGGDSQTEDAETIAFDSRNPPSRLLAWYRAEERDFRLGSELQEGAEYVLSGSTDAPDRDFTIRLAPGRNGGTSGMLLFTDR